MACAFSSIFMAKGGQNNNKQILKYIYIIPKHIISACKTVLFSS